MPPDPLRPGPAAFKLTGSMTQMARAGPHGHESLSRSVSGPGTQPHGRSNRDSGNRRDHDHDSDLGPGAGEPEWHPGESPEWFKPVGTSELHGSSAAAAAPVALTRDSEAGPGTISVTVTRAWHWPSGTEARARARPPPVTVTGTVTAAARLTAAGAGTLMIRLGR